MAVRKPKKFNADEERARAALDLIMRIMAVKDEELALRPGVGLSRPAIQARRAGGTRIREERQLAAGLEVPVELFSMDHADILRWFADERPDLSIRQYGCIAVYPGQDVRDAAA